MVHPRNQGCHFALVDALGLRLATPAVDVVFERDSPDVLDL